MPPLNLSVDYCGLRLRNPLVIAPAAITETAELIKKCEDAGAAAVVMKSYFEYEPARRHATPRFKIIRTQGPLASSVLYSFEQASIFDLAGYAREIERAKSICEIPVFASLNCITDEHWKEAARAVAEAGADGIEVNCSCPHGTHVMGGEDLIEAIGRAMELVREATDLPVVAKLTPQLTRPDEAALRLEELGAQAVVMFNRFTGLDIDIETGRPIMHGGYAGHGGPWAIHYVLRWLTATYPRISIPIAASGGVVDAEGAIKVMLAGATVVQVCSAVVVQGFGRIATILKGIEEYLEQKGIESVDGIIGNVCDKVLSLDEIDRRNRHYAYIDESQCADCGACERVCIYGAIEWTDGTRRVIPEKCDGCGLCAEICPTQAIAILERPVPIARTDKH